jgi:hypothetical protein
MKNKRIILLAMLSLLAPIAWRMSRQPASDVKKPVAVCGRTN